MTGKGVAPPPVRISLPVYLTQECLDQVSSQFPWLFPKQAHHQETTTEDGKPVVKRDVAALDVNVIENYKPFNVHGLEITPLPVLHGVDLESMGYSFTITGEDGTKKHVLYISDISHMIPETLEYIQTKLPEIDLFIVDTLLETRIHPVHFSLKQAIKLSNEIAAKKTFLVGMSCDAFPSHDEMNERLSKDPTHNVLFAHDGLVLYL
jgi:phosphoribosyl 1,2-cyclic phosphodiesterase